MTGGSAAPRGSAVVALEGFDALWARLGRGVYSSELAAHLGWRVIEVTTCLRELRKQGLVVPAGGGRWKKAEPTPEA